jgi:o-succinylbenzoate synthase
MKVLASQLAPFSAPLARPLANAHRSWSARRGLLLQVQRGDGSLGLGEASPLPDYSPDSLEDCQRYLKELRLFPEEELDMLRIREFVDRMPEELPAARFAVETALLDLLSQERGESIATLLGATESSASRCGLIQGGDPLGSVSELLERGLRCGKLKVGRNWTAELATIRALREQYPSFQLRLDANAAWSLPEALQNLQSLQNQNIQFVEQPVVPAKMYKLVGSPIPLAADESMHSNLCRESLGKLLRDRALVAVVLKPTVLGGLQACMDLKKWADGFGLASIASHCFEGAVGSAAVAELAVATKGRFPAGVDRHDALATLPQATIPQFRGDGIHSHPGGLGVVFSEPSDE